MARKPDPKPVTRTISIRLSMAEWVWIIARAQRLSLQCSARLTPTGVVHGLLRRFMTEEPEP